MSAGQSESLINELKALKLEKGGVYAIEIQKPITEDQLNALRMHVTLASDEFGVRFIIVGPNVKIAKSEA